MNLGSVHQGLKKGKNKKTGYLWILKWLQISLFWILFICLEVQHNEREVDTLRESMSYPLVHCPDSFNDQGSTGLNPGARNIIQDPRKSERSWKLEHSSVLSRPLARGWLSRRKAGHNPYGISALQAAASLTTLQQVSKNILNVTLKILYSSCGAFLS